MERFSFGFPRIDRAKMFAMKQIQILVLLCAAALTIGSSAQSTSLMSRKAVVVELFTSEGCSSCPPADALLGRLRQETLVEGVEVIPLGLHVDYWNHQGWIDRFSSASYTERQVKYADHLHVEGPYTPQMVVDGSWQFTGNDPMRALQAIQQAASRPSQADVQIAPAGEGKFQVTVKGAPNASGDVMLALTEDNLASKVSGGENSNRELHHSAVVRELRLLGHLRNGNFEDRVSVNLKKDWKREDLRIVVFAQQSHAGAIEGAASLPLADKSASAR
jgi:hypothetical protein